MALLQNCITAVVLSIITVSCVKLIFFALVQVQIFFAQLPHTVTFQNICYGIEPFTSTVAPDGLIQTVYQLFIAEIIAVNVLQYLTLLERSRNTSWHQERPHKKE